jgi:hypothetical protein
MINPIGMNECRIFLIVPVFAPLFKGVIYGSNGFLAATITIWLTPIAEGSWAAWALFKE